MEPQFNANIEGLEILGPLFLRPLSIRFGGEMGRGRRGAGNHIYVEYVPKAGRGGEEGSPSGWPWRARRVQFPNE